MLEVLVDWTLDRAFLPLAPVSRLTTRFILIFILLSRQQISNFLKCWPVPLKPESCVELEMNQFWASQRLYIAKTMRIQAPRLEDLHKVKSGSLQPWKSTSDHQNANAILGLWLEAIEVLSGLCTLALPLVYHWLQRTDGFRQLTTPAWCGLYVDSITNIHVYDWTTVCFFSLSLQLQWISSL